MSVESQFKLVPFHHCYLDLPIHEVVLSFDSSQLVSARSLPTIFRNWKGDTSRQSRISGHERNVNLGQVNAVAVLVLFELDRGLLAWTTVFLVIDIVRSHPSLALPGRLAWSVSVDSSAFRLARSAFRGSCFRRSAVGYRIWLAEFGNACFAQLGEVLTVMRALGR